MGEESIAQKPHTLGQGTVQYGRKRRMGGKKEGLIHAQKRRQLCCGGEKTDKDPKRNKLKIQEGEGKDVKTI